MKTIWHCIYFLSLIIISVSLKAQSLGKGQVLPAVQFSGVFNHSADTLTVAALDKKLVILDFWGTGCIGCIQAFPKMDSLQKKWGKDIQIVMVNQQSADSTRRFFKKRSKIKIPELPFITGDTLLQKLFLPVGLPMHVWLDQDKRVLAITKSASTNDTTISRYLRGEELKLSAYKSAWTSIPSLLDTNYHPLLRQFSYIGLSKTGTPYSYDEATRERNKILSLSFLSIEELYIRAYSETEGIDFNQPGRTVVEVADQYSVRQAPRNELYEDWANAHAYHYELAIPQAKASRLYEYMREDINRYFPIRAVIENRKHKVMALVQTGNMIQLQSKKGKKFSTMARSSEYGNIYDSLRCLQHVPFETFFLMLKGWLQQEYGLAFINTIKKDFLIDICLPGSTVESLAIPELNQALKKYGLTIREQEMWLPTLVLKDVLEK